MYTEGAHRGREKANSKKQGKKLMEKEETMNARLVDAPEHVLFVLVPEPNKLGQVGVAFGALGRVLVPPRSGQVASCERTPGDHAGAEQLAGREHFALLFAVDCGVKVLH